MAALPRGLSELTLQLPGCGDAATEAILARCTALEVLQLSCCGKLSAAGLRLLAAAPRLRSLRLLGPEQAALHLDASVAGAVGAWPPGRTIQVLRHHVHAPAAVRASAISASVPSAEVQLHVVHGKFLVYGGDVVWDDCGGGGGSGDMAERASAGPLDVSARPQRQSRLAACVS